MNSSIRVPLNASTFGDEEINAALEVLKSGFVTMGKQCSIFEEEFAAYLGVKNAVFVNSGSSANLLAFFALVNFACPRGAFGAGQAQPGQEVIVPAVTWSTTVWPIVQAGLVPVLVDADPLTLQINTKAIEEAINSKTVAICPVHVLGNSVAMDEIMGIAKARGLWVIEDTCESLGTTYENKFVGTIGDVGTYSFFFSHHMTTIEGGMIVTNNDELADLLRCLRAHGWSRNLKNRDVIENQHPTIDPRFLFVNTGFNLRPTELNAVFGRLQLKKLAGFNKRRVQIAETWNKRFSSFIDSKTFAPMQTTPGAGSTWFGYPIICESVSLQSKLKAHLERNGIETRPVICGNLARQPVFRKIPHRIGGPLPGADIIMDHGLFWGSHPVMSEQEIDHVTNVVKDFFK